MDGSSESQNSGNAPPPFLTKTYDMVDDASTDSIVSWSSTNNSFIVWNPPEFQRDLLPKYFKHSNFSSFVRQLNTYGFRKVDPDQWEFANEDFLRGQRNLLKNIHRRKPMHSHSQQQQAADATRYELEEEIQQLKRDKNLLIMELVRLRQQQQGTELQMQTLEERLVAMERRQHQMMQFLAKAMQKPGFVSQLVQQSETSNLLEAANKKRRLPKQEEYSEVGETVLSSGQIMKYQPCSGDECIPIQMKVLNTESLNKMELSLNSLESFLTDVGQASSEAVDGGSPVGQSSAICPTKMHDTSGYPDICISSGIQDIQASCALSGEHSCGSPLTEPIPCEVPCQTNLGLSLPQCEITRDVETINQRGKLEGPANMEPKPSGIDVNSEPVAMQLGDNDGDAGKARSTGKSGVNDIFWEQFLTESPGSPNTEEAESKMRESVNKDQDERLPENGKYWNRKQTLDRLTKQMGMLAPSTKS